MDHYKVLGLSSNASKDEIKEAFRDMAKKFHPDKHSDSPKSVKDGATIRFKQASEAYEVLIDDRKRADYNLRYNRSPQGATSGYGYGYGYGYDGGRQNSSDHYYYGRKRATVSKFEIALGYLNSRAFLLHVVFAGGILGGIIIIEKSRDALWKMQNSGKSFEAAMESIDKTKPVKENE